MARRSGSSGEKTAAEVRRAALELFAEHGYAAVSMRQIAAEVGVQAGALYLYTPDKQSLLADIMVAHMQDLLEAWARWPKPGAGEPLAMFEAFVGFHVRYHLERGAEVFISYMELRNLEPANFARVEVLRRSYEAVLTEMLTTGCRAGASGRPRSRRSTSAWPQVSSAPACRLRRAEAIAGVARWAAAALYS